MKNDPPRDVRGSLQISDSPMDPVVVPIVMSVTEVSAALGIGRTSIYKAIADSRLETRTFGRRRLVLTASVLRLLAEPSDAG